MAAEEHKQGDFYEVMGLDKDCTTSELREAYKKLALRWHPDRCSASGNSKFVEDAKTKFQTIQEAYSVLSDDHKRSMYDLGVCNSDDDDENGMGDFLNEMASMMTQSQPNEDGEGKSFENLQDLFDEMFTGEGTGFGSSASPAAWLHSSCLNTVTVASISSSKRNFSEMGSRNTTSGVSGGMASGSAMHSRQGRGRKRRRGAGNGSGDSVNDNHSSGGGRQW